MYHCVLEGNVKMMQEYKGLKTQRIENKVQGAKSEQNRTEKERKLKQNCTRAYTGTGICFHSTALCVWLMNLCPQNRGPAGMEVNLTAHRRFCAKLHGRWQSLAAAST